MDLRLSQPQKAPPSILVTDAGISMDSNESQFLKAPVIYVPPIPMVVTAAPPSIFSSLESSPKSTSLNIGKALEKALEPNVLMLRGNRTFWRFGKFTFLAAWPIVCPLPPVGSPKFRVSSSMYASERSNSIVFHLYALKRSSSLLFNVPVTLRFGIFLNCS